MRFKCSAFDVKWDEVGTTNTLQKLIVASVKDATRAFFREVWAEMETHVKTGMAINSMVPLGRFLKNVPTHAPTPKVSAEKGYPASRYPGGIKSAETGIIAGENAFSFEESELKMTFSFKIKVYHWVLSEGKKWNSLDAAEEAFMARLDISNLNKKITKVIENGFKIIDRSRH